LIDKTTALMPRMPKARRKSGERSSREGRGHPGGSRGQ
jgi:hypothetical protein